MGAVFIAGTGTDIGKTYLTCALIRYFKAQQQPIHAIKPVISGYDEARPEKSDTFQIAHAMGLPCSDATARALSPWRFAAPLSPHLAARREGKILDETRLLQFCREHITSHTHLLIEGAGGVLSPLGESMLNLDLAVQLQLPVFLVTSSYLGSIGHTLSAIESLERRNIALLGLVVNATAPSMQAMQEDTVSSLRQFCPTPYSILSLPYGDENVSLSTIEPIAALLP